jgi:hypothetical protein
VQSCSNLLLGNFEFQIEFDATYIIVKAGREARDRFQGTCEFEMKKLYTVDLDGVEAASRCRATVFSCAI